MLIDLKLTAKGIVYDTKTAAPKCCFRHGLPPGSIVETAYQTPNGCYFLVQQTDFDDPKIIPMSGEEMAKWSSPVNSGKLFQRK